MERSQVALNNITLAILAGGAGSRMGQPKSLLQIQGRPILEHLLEQIDWPGPTWLITAPGREHPPGWEKFHREIADPVADMGPLRGVMTALENVATPLLFVATVDMPGVRCEHLQWLASQIQATAQIGLMCQRSTRTGSAIEPFPLVLRQEALEVVRSRLQSQLLTVVGLLEEPHFLSVAAPPDWNQSVWLNLNRPSDLDHLTAEHGPTKQP